MACAAPSTPLRRLLDEHFSQIMAEVEKLLREARERARGESFDLLNQSARRLHQARNAEELAATLADAAAGFAGGVAVFRIEGEVACGERIHGVNEDAAERFRSLRVPLAGAAALAGAVTGRDPVIAAATPTELSTEMMELAGHRAGDRVSIFPLVVAGAEPEEGEPRTDSAFALLYSWGEVEIAALELLSQVAAAVWPRPEPQKVVTSELVQIESTAPRKSWEDLPPAEQQLHLRAQRFARVRASEIRLRHGQAVQAGRARRDLYASLQPEIDGARQEFRETFFTACASMVDYLHLELVRVLANDEIGILGKDYPGPML
jgi:hypothetical protein